MTTVCKKKIQKKKNLIKVTRLKDLVMASTARAKDLIRTVSWTNNY